MTQGPLQLRVLLEQLVGAEIRFILVGGLAVNAWGYLRGTRDIDLVPDPDQENLDRLATLLEGLEGGVVVGDQVTTSSAIRTFLHAGDKTLVRTRLGEVDVLQGLPQIPRYAELLRSAEVAEVEGTRVAVCSLEHLRAMKRAADRPMDRIDLEALDVAHSSEPRPEARPPADE